MIFDTWGGVLTTPAYHEFSLEYMRRIIEHIPREHNSRAVPVVLFTKGGRRLDRIARQERLRRGRARLDGRSGERARTRRGTDRASGKPRSGDVARLPGLESVTRSAGSSPSTAQGPGMSSTSGTASPRASPRTRRRLRRRGARAQPQVPPRILKDAVLDFAKGFCIGAADVVPGVSGGTMAFILGIYRRLVEAIRSFDAALVRLLFAGRFRHAIRHVDLALIAPLALGIFAALLFFTRVVPLPRLIETHPDLVYGLFFGLIVASIVVLIRSLEGRPPGRGGQ